MMLPYNTDMEPMLLPEYGRHFQGLVDYCVAIPDRDERTACAYAIADTMASSFPELVLDENDYSQIWNVLNILSRFELDIDFPCEVISAEKLNPKPKKIPYSNPKMRFRHYGKNIEKMIEQVSQLEEGEDKKRFVELIANYMKRLMLQHNREGAEDSKILKDLSLFSNGAISLNSEDFKLQEFNEGPSTRIQNKKKKRK